MMQPTNDNKERLLGSSGDSFGPYQCYKQDTYYQILEINPPKEEEKRKRKHITTSIVAKQRGTGENYSTENSSFDNYKINSKTKEKLKSYYPHTTGDQDILSSYLPSPGVVFPDGLMKSFINNVTNQTDRNNFHDSLRNILISRKLSQLIAKTWWA
ncbi:MAG: hypothetical protein MJK14_07360 [Rivularia sp. ALOHA_DT_140]|nr:hypothetical protein [Rivularia sp. ALOHA_DT_140]